jgi:hypothetical protein
MEGDVDRRFPRPPSLSARLLLALLLAGIPGSAQDYTAPPPAAAPSGGGGGGAGGGGGGGGGLRIIQIQNTVPQETRAGGGELQGSFQSERGMAADKAEAAAKAAEEKFARGAKPAPETEPGRETAAEEAATAAPPPPMELSDARLNFDAVVRGYLNWNGEGGVWKASDPGGRTLSLSLKGLDKNTVAAAEKPGFYTGTALMADEAGKSVPVRFTTDFTGTDWSVASYEVLTPRARRRAAKR